MKSKTVKLQISNGLLSCGCQLALIESLVTEMAKRKPLVEEREIILGFESLEYSLSSRIP